MWSTSPTQTPSRAYDRQQSPTFPSQRLQAAAARVDTLLTLLRSECEPGSAEHRRVLLSYHSALQSSGVGSDVLQQLSGDSSAHHRSSSTSSRNSRGDLPPMVALALLHLVAHAQQQQQLQQQQEAGTPQQHQQQPYSSSSTHSIGPIHLSDSRFLAAYQEELQRLRGAIASVHEEVLLRLATLGAALPPLPETSSQGVAAPPSPGSHSGSDALALQLAQCNALAAEVAALDDFSRGALSAMGRLGQLYDARMAAAGGGKAAPLLTAVYSHSAPMPGALKHTIGVPPDVYHQSVHRYLSGATPLEPLLWGLATCYARLKEHSSRAAAAAATAAAGGGAAGGGSGMGGSSSAQWTAPDKFTRSTTKYWVHPAHLTRLKLALCRHLPLLVYGARNPVHHGDIATPGALAAAGAAVRGLVSSVYFDNPQLAVYHTRLRRDDGARLVRLRHYGPRVPGQGEAQVWVERKTHRQGWTGERSVKERGWLPQAAVPGYVSGSLPAGAAGGGKKALLGEVQGFLLAQGLAPALRTEYNRTAWQQYSSNNVRVSLDEDMLLVREGPSLVAPGDWCSSAGLVTPLAGGDLVRFPYGVLEVKLQEEAPAWIEDLKACGVLVEVSRFSKFLHGMALLHGSATAVSPCWFLEDARSPGTFTPATIEEMADGRCKYEEEASRWLIPGAASPAGSSPRATRMLGAVKSALGRFGARSKSPGVTSIDQVTGDAADQLEQQLPASTAVVPRHGPTTDEWWRALLLTAYETPASSGAVSSGSAGGGGVSGSFSAAAGGAAVPLLPRPARKSDSGSQAQLPHGEANGHGPRSRSTNEAGAEVPPQSNIDPSSGATTPMSSDLAVAVVNHGLTSGTRRVTPSDLRKQEHPLERHSSDSNNSLTVSDPGSSSGSNNNNNQGDRHMRSTSGSSGSNTPRLIGAGQPTANGLAPAAAAAAGGALAIDLSGYLGRVTSPSASPSKEALLGGGKDTAAALLLPLSAPVIASSTSSTTDAGAGSGSGNKVWRQKLAAWGSRLKRQGSRSSLGGGRDQGPPVSPNEHLMAFTGAPNRALSIVRTRIEPKTFFANERTFLSWLQIGVLVLMTGLGLLTGSTVMMPGSSGSDACRHSRTCRAAQISGACISPVAVLMMAYALFQYKRRSIQILRRQVVRYDDQAGPVALVLLLVVISIVCVALAVSTMIG